MARMVRAELAPGEREKLLSLGAAACSARAGRVLGGKIRKNDEGHREIIELEGSGRSITIVRLSGRDCSRLDLHLYAERPNWHRLSSARFLFHVPAEGDVLVDRDEYSVFLEEKDAWLRFELRPMPNR